MPPSSSGKADGVQILKGADIPSQHVDPSKHYLSGRKIESLEKVGALSGIEQQVAMRADGIIANLPANGRLEAAELVRMESPQVAAVLYPEEKAALPNVWSHLVTSASNPQPVTAPTTEMTVSEQLTKPNGLTYPEFVAIASLPAELQAVAKRVELGFNADGKATTIQIADIDHVLAAPAAFTPDEIDQLQTIKAIFHEQATSAAQARAVVPAPSHTSTSAAIGSMSLELTSDITVVETRKVAHPYGDWYQWGGTLFVRGDFTATLHPGAGASAIVIDLDSGKEQTVSGTDETLSGTGAGTVIVERYTNGQRVETNAVAFPAFTPGQRQHDISKYLDYQLVLADQTPLVKNAVRTSRVSGLTEAEFSFDTTAVAPSPNVDLVALDAVATPTINLPAGRYEFNLHTLGPVKVDVYPQNVMIVSYAGNTDRLNISMSYGDDKRLKNMISGRLFRFEPSENRLYDGDTICCSEYMTPASRTQ